MKPTRSVPKIVHQNPFYRVSFVEMDFGDFKKDYYVTDFGERVGMLAFQDGKILLTRQYRFLVDGLAWEVPGGTVGEDESIEVAAVRECCEETGMVCGNIQKLISYHESLDVIHTPTHIFYSHECSKDPGYIRPPKEVIESRWIDFGECFEMIEAGEILDGFSILALMTYKNKISNHICPN